LTVNVINSQPLAYNMATYKVYGRCGQYGRCVFIYWPVRPVHGLYGPRPDKFICRINVFQQLWPTIMPGLTIPWSMIN